MSLLRRGSVGVAVCLLALTGCTSLGGTGDKQFIDGGGSVRIIEPADRGDPIDFEGRTLTGDEVSADDYRGKVLVVNKWWSGCGPCRSEMPLLAEAADELSSEAAFLGINIRDASADQGLAFMRGAGADYPSLWDVKGTAILAFSQEVPMVAIPATVVLDAEGRAAAVISGEIPSKQTLVDVVDEVAGETADG
ncbi:TlpA disulfide reductase family protein [Nocardioides sp. T2.26MG-1]|uniref:TlpA disulfide reductase family protein n=1 Tax=Nocardioides sp. T2.26MG-1 TaxID=3041166 RepID=UPI002477B33E|nr:TlpA disulfide reductase family protein [Nocardioides sp. T2.26MG-1]CAI9400061.1 Thiol-disulfide oxidoreductase ResA [Nocardioides sp. T2.26MG-1]